MNTTTTTKTARRLRTVAGVLALTIACSSGAYAATAITSSNQIKNGVVNTGDIKNGTVKVKDLNAKTVTQLEQLEDWKTANLTGRGPGSPATTPPASASTPPTAWSTCAVRPASARTTAASRRCSSCPPATTPPTRSR